MRIVTPKTAEGLSCAIAARQDGLGARNLISPAHHPHGGCFISGDYEDSDTGYGRSPERNHNQQGGVTYVKGMTSVRHHPKGGVVYIERKR